MPSRDSIPFNLYKIKSPGIARVWSNVRLTPAHLDDVRHIVVDLDGLEYRYLEGQSLGVMAPGVSADGKPNKLRLYSIASTRSGDDGGGRTASLCVKRLIYRDEESGQDIKGVASNFLCDAVPGDPVAVTGPVGKAFLLPEDPTSNLIMVATGTGIAPFRAFLLRAFRERSDWTGKVYLFFGVRTEAEFLYRQELEEMTREFGVQLVTAFSREQTTAEGKRMYVQHRIAERVEEVWSLLQDEKTYFYICGLKGMEEGIEQVLETRCHAEGGAWTSFREQMHESDRYLVETY